MKNHLMRFSIADILVALVVCCAARQTDGQTQKVHYVVTDDNVPVNTATFYRIDQWGNLSLYKTVKTGGVGGGPSYFAARYVTGVDEHNKQCAFVVDLGSNDIAGIVVQTQEVTGNFKGSSSDEGGADISLAMNHKYLYAAFRHSKTVATFAVKPRCKLEFMADIAVVGLNGGAVDGMAVNGKILVVAYADGSIQSFDISGGVPVSNNDEQLSTGYLKDGGEPAGVRITTDGHYAIFGDAGFFVEVEVSDISSGKLIPTVDYGGSGGGLGPGNDSNNIRLSSDESLLYISVNYSGEVAAAFFDKTNGILAKGCTSGPLNGYRKTWGTTNGIAAKAIAGRGDVIFVAEANGEGRPSVALIQVDSNHGQCKLTEKKHSPVSDPNGGNMWSIRVF
jgi:hypothetical protein